MNRTLHEGLMVDGFKILKVIKDSAWGTVYKVKPADLDRVYALKLAKPGSWDKIVNERTALAKIGRHSNVTEIFFAGVDVHDNPYIVEEYVESNLAELLDSRERKTVDHATALSITKQILSGLLAAHSKQIIHQDLKPENILIEEEKGPEQVIRQITHGADRSYKVKLCDFGMAAVVEKEPELEISLDDATGAAGTLRYLSPEQKDGGRITYKTDIYVVGLILYKMLTGKLPHINYPKASQVHYPPKGSLNEMRKKWSWVDDVIEKALQPNPKDRYHTVTEMLTAITKGMTPEKKPEPKGPSLAQRTRAKLKSGFVAVRSGAKTALKHTVMLPIYLISLPVWIGIGTSKMLEDKFRYSHGEIGFITACAAAIGYYFILPAFAGEQYLKYHLSHNPTSGTIIAFHDDSSDHRNKHFALIDARRLPDIHRIKIPAPDVVEKPLFVLTDDGRYLYYTTANSLVEVEIPSGKRNILAKSEILNRFSRLIHKNNTVYALLDTEVWSISHDKGLTQQRDNLDALKVPEPPVMRDVYELDKVDFPKGKRLEIQFQQWYLLGNFDLDEGTTTYSWVDTDAPFKE